MLLGDPCVKVEGNSLTLWSKLFTGYLNITVIDTAKFEEINIRHELKVLSSAHFVPNCSFPTPYHGIYLINFCLPLLHEYAKWFLFIIVFRKK